MRREELSREDGREQLAEQLGGIPEGALDTWAAFVEKPEIVTSTAEELTGGQHARLDSGPAITPRTSDEELCQPAQRRNWRHSDRVEDSIPRATVEVSISMTSYEPKPAASHARRASDSEAQGGSTVAGRLILALVCVAQLMVVLDVSIVNVALPSIGAGLGFSPTALQWMINAYNIAFGGFLLFAGRAADLYGPKRTFLAGVGVFSAASMAGGLAPSSEVLVVARFLALFSATRPLHSRRVAQPACWGR